MVYHRFLISTVLLAFLATMSGCTVLSRLTQSNDDKLPGKRESVNLQPNSQLGIRSQDPIRIEGAKKGTLWSHPRGNAQHKSEHIATDKRLTRLWTSTIGSGTNRRLTQLAEPLIIGNIVFAMDSRAQVSAVSLRSGQTVWSRDLSSARERSGYFGGGISYARGRLFITTGYGQVMALAAKTGKIVWRQRLSAPARSAPTESNGRLFVQTTDNKLFALNASSGRVIWQHAATQEQTGLIGSASPSVDGDVVAAAFSSGEVFLLSAADGSVKWSDSLTPLAGTGLLTELTDIKANPILDNGQLILVSNAGKTAVFNVARGTEVWQAPVGGSQTPVVSGNQIFLMAGGAVLTAINRDTGTISWRKRLKSVIPKRLSPDVPLAWFGPLLAGNKLMVVSAEGELVYVDPRNGKTISKENIGGNAVLAPVGSNGYVLFTTDRGRLIAYR